MTNETHKDTHTSQQKNDVEAQTSPIKETSSQVSGSDTESLLENQTTGTPVQCPNDTKKQQNEIQRNETDIATYDNGDDNISPPEITTSEIEERLVRDVITYELYMPLSSTIVLKRKEEMLYVPLDFENGLTIDDLVESGAYVSATVQKELDRIKQKAPSIESQSNIHSEAGIFSNHMTQNSGPEEGHDMVTGATEQTCNGHDMVLGVQE